MAEEVTSADIEALLQQGVKVHVAQPEVTREPSPLRPYIFPIALGGLLVIAGLIAEMFLG